MTVPGKFAGRTAAIIALGAAVVVVVAVISLTLVLLYGGQSEETAENLRTLGRFHAEIDARPQIESVYADLKNRLAEMPPLVHAASGAPAAAQVEAAIRKIVSENGGEIRSSQSMPSANANGFEVVSVDCDLTVPASHIQGLLYAVETSRPYLFIDTADISAPTETGANADPAYELRWTVHAFRWSDAR